MFESNLANLTAQYQQTYLVYCYKVMQYLQAYAWLAEQQKTQKQPKIEQETTSKAEKCTSGQKKLDLNQNQKKPNFKATRHKGKAKIVKKIAMSFTKDAFGKPRGGDWSDMGGLFEAKLDFADVDANGNLIGNIDISKRGFTDHEHLDEMQLIHMNGRMYDYNNGRFLSVDPFIIGTSTQSLNPYTYIFNNPLSGRDPSGYIPCRKGPADECQTPKERRKEKKQKQREKRGWVTVYQRNNGIVTTHSLPKEVQKAISDLSDKVLELAGIKEWWNSDGPAVFGFDSAQFKENAPAHLVAMLQSIESEYQNPNGAIKTKAHRDLEIYKVIQFSAAIGGMSSTNGDFAKIGGDVILAAYGIKAYRGLGSGKVDKPSHPTFQPGPYAGEYILARSSSQTFNALERVRINEIGNKTGCHTCGSPIPGTKTFNKTTNSYNFVPDHQPVSAFNIRGHLQKLYPQCINCSRNQGLATARAVRE